MYLKRLTSHGGTGLDVRMVIFHEALLICYPDLSATVLCSYNTSDKHAA